MTEKLLAASLFVLFALSAAYLFSVNERGLDPDQGKNWWSIAFAAPGTETDLAFTVSNHTATNRFVYTISAEGKIIAEGELSVEPGTNMTHVPTINFMPQSGRITITVTHDAKEETIYRSL
ncbi:MAG: hypothetical protein WAT81_04370 [Candidatus Moraniibacteriota bacterium]